MEPHWSFPFLFLVTWFQIILQCQSGFSSHTQDGHRHHFRAHSQSQKFSTLNKSNKFKVKSVCFPLEFLDAIDLEIFKKWSALEHHFQDQTVPKELLLEENSVDDAFREPRSFRSTDKSGRRKRRFPDHMNPAYQSFTFLRRDECPPSANGNTRYFCPTKGGRESHICIERDQLCDDVPDCPNSEDEAPEHCFFQRPMMAQMKDIITRLNMMVSMFSKPLYLIESEEMPLAHNEGNRPKKIRIEPVFTPRSPKIAQNVREETLDQIQAIQNMMDLKRGNHFLDSVQGGDATSTLSTSLLEHLRGLQNPQEEVASDHEENDDKHSVDGTRSVIGEFKERKLE